MVPFVICIFTPPFLPRREFKLFGGQLSDSGSELSYNSICKQIDEGLQEGFTESEIIRTVIKITKPGTFREMLTIKDNLTVEELKRFLGSHIREKVVVLNNKIKKHLNSSCTDLWV